MTGARVRVIASLIRIFTTKQPNQCIFRSPGLISAGTRTTDTGAKKMGIADLSGVLKVFSGGELTEEELATLFKEVLLMVLARASSSDANIAKIEVTSIQTMLKEATGDDFTEQQIRQAANSALYEKAPFLKYLGRVHKKLNSSQRAMIASSLVGLMKSDLLVSILEVEFFNNVAKALDISPAELVGLLPRIK